jgi:hypothetical protein
VIGGLYFGGAGRDGLSSVLVGVPVLGCVYLATGGRGYGILSPALAGMLASAVAFAVARGVRR